MTALVARPDLSARTTLSKSALVGFDLCQTKAYFDLHDRRPMLPNEKVSFGSALDASVEALITGLREGWPTERTFEAAGDAVAYVQKRDGVILDIDELTRATRGFWDEVMPAHRWQSARTQVELRATIEGLGDVEGHPDILMPGAVWDVKSSSRQKDMPSLELGLYALLAEAAENEPVFEVGYFTWVRPRRWVTQRMAMTDEVRRWAWENAHRFAEVRRLPRDTQLAIASGPKFAGLCSDCQYHPRNGGPCAITFQGEVAE